MYFRIFLVYGINGIISASPTTCTNCAALATKIRLRKASLYLLSLSVTPGCGYNTLTVLSSIRIRMSSSPTRIRMQCSRIRMHVKRIRIRMRRKRIQNQMATGFQTNVHRMALGRAECQPNADSMPAECKTNAKHIRETGIDRKRETMREKGKKKR